MALSNSTIPYIRSIAKHGYKKSIAANKSLQYGLNIHKGDVTHPAVADLFDYDYTPVKEILS